MELLSDLRNATLGHWRQAGLWILMVVMGGLFPLWGGALLFVLWGQSPSLPLFLSHGEFYIYSAAIMAPTLYVLLSICRFGIVHIISIMVLLVNAVLFAGILSSNSFAPIIDVDKVFLRSSSIVLLALSIFITLCARVAENIQRGPDVRGMQRRAYDELEADLDTL